MKFFYEKRNCRDAVHLSHDLTFSAHIHEEIEVVYMIEGNAHAFAGGVECTISPGDFFIVFPGSVHYYDNCKDNLALVLIVSPKLIPEFRGVFTSSTPVRPIVKDVNSQAKMLLESALIYKGKHKDEAVRGMLLSAIAMILEKAHLSKDKFPSDNTLSSILEFCENNYTEDISLDSLSKKLGISKSHISHIFSKKLKMNFRDYINSLRLGRSIILLKEGNLGMTEVASESGFETIRTFNRAFKKRYNIPPLEYKKQFS